MSENEKLRPGAVVADRFRLERQLGQGGMGSVWLAHHLGLDMPCAVKFLRKEAALSADLRARFEREAKAAARLKSAHVVQTLDHGVWEETPYIAMEYLEGEDLNQRLRRLRRLDARETVRIVAQVARALAKAHGAGMVHRDLKPSNIFLARDDDQEVAKVLDFGVAKRAITEQSTDQETRSGSLLGTPHYMSPEQAQGTRVVDHRSDLWSLAIVVYQCMTGQLPFRSDALGDLLVQIIVNPPPVPSHVAPLPTSFDAWWAKAVARDPADRYQSARELVATLAASLGVAFDAESATNEGASIFVPPAVAAAAMRSLEPRSGPQTGDPMLTPHSLPPLPTPTSSIVPRPEPGSTSGPHSAGPTANLVAQSVSIAQQPRRSRARVVVYATIAGVALGGVVAVLAPGSKGETTAGAAVGSSAPAAGAEAQTAAPSATVADTPTPAPSATPAATADSTPPNAATNAPSAPSSQPMGASPATAPKTGDKPPKPAGPKPPRKHPDFGI